MQSDPEGGGELERLLAQVDEIVVSRGLSELAARRESLAQLMNSIIRVVQDFASSRGLHMSRISIAGDVHVDPDGEWQQTRLSVHAPDDKSTPAVYRVERRGANEYVALVDGEEIWRGESADVSLTNAIQMAIAKQFLATHADHSTEDD
jgi:hypothetical protein